MLATASNIGRIPYMYYSKNPVSAKAAQAYYTTTSVYRDLSRKYFVPPKVRVYEKDSGRYAFERRLKLER